MSTTTPGGLVVPELADGPPDGPAALMALALSMDPYILKPMCKLILPANFGVANASNTVTVPFGSGSEYIKTHAGMHSVSTNNTRIIAVRDGVHRAKANVFYAPQTPAAGFRACSIGLNGVRQGTEQGIYTTGALPTGSNYPLPMVETELKMTAGQYVELFTFQNSGNTLNVIGDGNSANTGITVLVLEWLRPLP